MIITIDGETYTMKSTVAKLVAKRFGFVHISCGIIFRALTFIALRENADTADSSALVAFAKAALKDISVQGDKVLYCGTETEKAEIDSARVFETCNRFSSSAEIEQAVYNFLRGYASSRNVVVDGRESGSIIFPNAQFKYYFVASSERFYKAVYGEKEQLGLLNAVNERDKEAGIVKRPEDAVCLSIEDFSDPQRYADRIISDVVDSVASSVKKGKAYALVPARSGSTGCPDKNIRNLCGHPLIEYPIRAAQRTGVIQRVVFTSDSEIYCEIAKKAGAYVPFIRPPELATPTSTDLEFFTHAVYMLYGLDKCLPEFFILLRATTPVRDPAVIKRLLDILKSSHGATSIRTAHEAKKSPYKMFSMDADGYYHSLIWDVSIDDINVPRQVLPKAYVPNGYVDIFRTENIIRTHTLYGQKVLGYETEETVDIDTQEDFAKAEKLLSSDRRFGLFGKTYE